MPMLEIVTGSIGGSFLYVSQSLKQVSWTRSSTSDREGSPHRHAVRIMVRLMGFPTRETNSSHASSSRGPAQRQTTSFSDKDEYRIGLGLPGASVDFRLSPSPSSIVSGNRPA